MRRNISIENQNVNEMTCVQEKGWSDNSLDDCEAFTISITHASSQTFQLTFYNDFLENGSRVFYMIAFPIIEYHNKIGVSRPR